MARRVGHRPPRPAAEREETLDAVRRECPACRRVMAVRYSEQRRVETLEGRVDVRLKIRRCTTPGCERCKKAYRPEAEGRLALPRHQFGLDVIAHVGLLRYQEHRSVPEMHQRLREAGLWICERTVTSLLHAYDALVTLKLDAERRAKLAAQGRVILAIDGLQPTKGNDVLWVVRDCLSGEVLRGRSLLSSSGGDLAALIREVATEVAGLGVTILAAVSDGEPAIRKAVAEVLPEVPHQLCHFHYLRQAAKPLVEADQHAKKELKKGVRGVRPIERSVEESNDPEAEVIQGYCAAVRRALTCNGQPPLGTPGLHVHEQLSQIKDSLERVVKKGGTCPNNSSKFKT